MTQSNIHKSEDKERIKIDITEYDQEWIERIGKAAYELARNRIKSEEHNDFIVKSSDPVLLGCISRAIEQHLDSIPTKLKPTFQQMLDDIKARKEDLERS